MNMRSIESSVALHARVPSGALGIPSVEELAPHLRLLLRAMADPRSCVALDESEWDLLLRAARSARLLGTLATRLGVTVQGVCAIEANQTDAPGMLENLPQVVQRQLQGALIEARFRRHKLLHVLDAVSDPILGATTVCLALKGAAYVLQESAWAAGRLPADVDLMVPREALDDVEQALLAAGWEFEKQDDYDQRYYREWSHELPPMRCAGMALELDLHHAILPPLGRARPDPRSVIDSSQPVAGCAYRVPSLQDQVLHSAAHLFQDSDGSNRLRDLFDFNGLLTDCLGPASTAGRVDGLVHRARELQLAPALALAAAFAAAWCANGAAAAVLSGCAATGVRPGRTVCSLLSRVLGPPDPVRPPPLGRALATRALELRALTLRFPPKLLLFHASAKAWRALRAPRHPEAEAP